MKTKSIYTLLGMSALSIGLIGCSKSTREEAGDKAAAAYQTSKEAVVNTWNDAKDFTFEKSSDFKDRAEAMSSEADAKIAKLKAEYAEKKASASRSAAMDKITSARADLSAKIAALGDATAETWESAKADVIAAGKRLEAAYDDFVADKS